MRTATTIALGVLATLVASCSPTDGGGFTTDPNGPVLSGPVIEYDASVPARVLALWPLDPDQTFAAGDLTLDPPRVSATLIRPDRVPASLLVPLEPCDTLSVTPDDLRVTSFRWLDVQGASSLVGQLALAARAATGSVTVGDVSYTYLLASSDGRIEGSCGGSDGGIVVLSDDDPFSETHFDVHLVQGWNVLEVRVDALTATEPRQPLVTTTRDAAPRPDAAWYYLPYVTGGAQEHGPRR
jgi:hypothetical protein